MFSVIRCVAEAAVAMPKAHAGLVDRPDASPHVVSVHAGKFVRVDEGNGMAVIQSQSRSLKNEKHTITTGKSPWRKCWGRYGE
ncbi:MAG: hypothetical protein Tsb002_35570 [Wenzhouxiangellaceae bacterium]